MFLPPGRQIFFPLLVLAQLCRQLFSIFCQVHMPLLKLFRLPQTFLILGFSTLAQFAGRTGLSRQRLPFPGQPNFLLFQPFHLAFGLTEVISFVHNYLELVEHQVPGLMNLLFQGFERLILFSQYRGRRLQVLVQILFFRLQDSHFLFAIRQSSGKECLALGQPLFFRGQLRLALNNMFQPFPAKLQTTVGFLQSQTDGCQNPVIVQQLFIVIGKFGAQQFAFALGHRHAGGGGYGFIQCFLLSFCQPGQLFLRQVVPVDEQSGFALKKLGIQFIIPAGFLGAFPQGLNLRLDLRHDIPNAGEVLFRVFQLAHGILTALLEPGDADDLFEQQPALLRFAVQDLVDLVLTDHRHGFPAQTCSCQQFLQIFEAAMGFIDVILALTRAEYSARYRHFAEIQRQ